MVDPQPRLSLEPERWRPTSSSSSRHLTATSGVFNSIAVSANAASNNHILGSQQTAACSERALLELLKVILAWIVGDLKP